MKIGLGCPVNTGMDWQTQLSMMEVAAVRGLELGHEFTFISQRSSVVEYNRCKIVQNFLDHSSLEALLWFDADAYFTPEHIASMIARNVSIVAACFTGSTWPPRPAYGFLGLDLESTTPGGDIPDHCYHSGDLINLTRRSPTKLAYIGGHCVLVKREVYEKLPDPWYATPVPSTWRNLISEDFYFSILAQKYNYDLYVDCAAWVRHIGRYLYGIDDWLNLPKELRK